MCRAVGLGQTLLLSLGFCCLGHRHSMMYYQQVLHVQVVNIQKYCLCFLGEPNVYMCTFFSFGAGRSAPQGCANKNVHFIRQYTTYPFVLTGIYSRVSVSFSRLTVSFLTDNCFGAPWGNKCRGCVRFARRSEINRSVKKNMRRISAAQ